MEVGTALPPLERRIALPDMVAYAGATWDWHRLHYDADYLEQMGVAAPVVDGQMFGALLAEHVLHWAGPRARVRRMAFRFGAMVFAGETVRVEGEVTDVDGHAVTVTQRLLGDEQKVAIDGATCVVEMPEVPR